jgi:hypothetical protein
MLIVMKPLCVLVLAAGSLYGAQIQDVKTVYIFPMHNGFDQYLVDGLTEQHVFRVVTDPKTADAIFTDTTGPAFEQMFAQRVLDVKPAKDEEKAHASFHSRGTLFLVSRNKQVIWSTYAAAKDNTPKQLRIAARRSVERLKKVLNPKPAGPSS